MGWGHRHAHGKYSLCLGIPCRAGPGRQKIGAQLGRRREWMAMRDMDVAASVIGIRPTYAKLSALP